VNSSCDQALQILLVEDSALDAKLIVAALQEAGLNVQLLRVDDEPGFCRALEQQVPDAILSDWTLPQFSGEKAFGIARTVCPQVPFIFVSGTISESAAINAMRQGAVDYIFKHQLALLSLVVNRAIREARARQELAEADSLKLAILNSVSAGIAVLDSAGVIVTVNARWREFAQARASQDGTAAALDVGANYLTVCQGGGGDASGADARAICDGICGVLRASAASFDIDFPSHLEPRPRWFSMHVTPLGQGPTRSAVITQSDISQRKQDELKLLTAVAQAQRFRDALDHVSAFIYMKDDKSRYVYANRPTQALFGKSAQDLVGSEIRSLFPQSTAERSLELDAKVLAGESTSETFELVNKQGVSQVCWEVKTPIYDEVTGGKVVGICCISTDITSLRAAEEAQTRHTRRAEALLLLPGAAETLDERAFMQRSQELAEELTGSQIAFTHLVNDDQESIELVAWSHATLAHYCQAAFDTHYPVSQAGIWADALRQRAPVIVNDYATAIGKKGLPEGHARLDRLVSVPVIQGNLVRMMTGVGNKPTPYTDWDVETVRLISDAVWRIVRQRRADAAMRESEQRHRVLADNLVDVIWTTDFEGCLTYVSPSVEKLRGYTCDEVMQQSLDQALCPGSIPLARQVFADIKTKLAAGQPVMPFKGEFEQPCKDGRSVWTEVSTSGLRNAEGAYIGIVGVSRDITERRAQQEQIRIAASVFEYSREGITVTDASGNIVLVNRAFTEITGFSSAEVLGRNPRLLKSGRQSADFYIKMWEQLTGVGHWAGEIWNRKKDGTLYPEWLAITATHNEFGETTHYVGSFSDLSSSKAAENRIQWLSQFDALTSLPNRTLLEDRAAQAFRMAHRSGGPVTMMLVRVDHFSALNDSLGHAVGDQLLIEVATRLAGSVRAQDTVARVEGKEFALLLPETNSSGAAHLATELTWKLAQSYHIEGQELPVTVSIGIAIYPENGTDFDALFKAIEISMNRARALGRDGFQFFSNDLYAHLLARDQMVGALRHAAGSDQLQVLYQPQADLQSGRISGMEALLRWHHPELGTVAPARFIPLAEESNLIIEIGQWVLRRVCRDLRGWLDQGIKVPHVAVNVSPLQFRNNDLMAQVKSALSEFRIDPSLLYIEVTEGALMDDGEDIDTLFRELKGLGLKLSLDDFGTGYSSLSCLKRFPFDQVKIDQSFVRDVASNRNDAVIVNVIVSMAHGLGLKVIAEGVETEAQCETMRTSVCDEIQGHLFSWPLASEGIDALFRSNQQLPAHLLRHRKPSRTLLLVDDEPNILAALRRLFRRDGHVILTAGSGPEGLDVLSKHKVDVIISDQRMPGMTGVEFLRAAKAIYPDTIRIVLSGYTELQSVTDAINEGAVYRFITKPWEDDALREHVHNAFEFKELIEENQQLNIKIRTSNQELVATNRHLDDVLQKTRSQIEREETSLAIVREAFQHIPSPVMGVDDEGVAAFVSAAAERLFAHAGQLLGVELAHTLPELHAALLGAAEGVRCPVLIDGKPCAVQWHQMGAHSRSQGRILIFSTTGANS